MGRVSLNAYRLPHRNRPCPVIEVLAGGGSVDGELCVLKVLRQNDNGWDENMALIDQIHKLEKENLKILERVKKDYKKAVK